MYVRDMATEDEQAHMSATICTDVERDAETGRQRIIVSGEHPTRLAAEFNAANTSTTGTGLDERGWTLADEADLGNGWTYYRYEKTVMPSRVDMDALGMTVAEWDWYLAYDTEHGIDGQMTEGEFLERDRRFAEVHGWSPFLKGHGNG